MHRTPAGVRPFLTRRLVTRPTTARIALAYAFAIAVASAGCDNPTAARPDFAYDPTALTGGLLYRWTTGATVRVFVDPMTTSGATLTLAVQRAVRAWNTVPQEREFALALVANRDAADIIVYDRSVAQPVATGSCAFDPSGAAGYTYFCAVNGRAERLRPIASTMLTAALVIRVDMTTTATQASLDALVAHEMGHAVGIGGHSPQTSDVMYTRPTTATPTDRDRATLRNLLGRAADITL